MGKSALVLGATGVVGRELVRELCESRAYDEVEAWARREIGFATLSFARGSLILRVSRISRRINSTKFFARLARR